MEWTPAPIRRRTAVANVICLGRVANDPFAFIIRQLCYGAGECGYVRREVYVRHRYEPTRRGWRTALGPGRHPISSCYFWYFHSPCGGAAEYDFDSDLVDERWVPGEFQQTPEVFAEWCLAEGMADTLLYKGVQTGDTIKSKS